MNGLWITAGISGYCLFIFIGASVAIRSIWGALAKHYPPQPEEEDAASRMFQSASIGILNLGWCVGITVDSKYMHLKPNFILQLVSRRSMSIPWSEIEPGKHSFFKRYRSFKVYGFTVTLPTWAVDLAKPIDLESSDEPS